MFIVILRTILSSVFLFFVVSAHAATLVVNDPRPVAKAMEQLETLYGVPITYEDPPYVHESEILDVTAQVRRDEQTNRVLIPLGGTFSFFTHDVPPMPDAEHASVAVQSALKATAISNTITEVLYAYAALRHAEMFKVTQDKGLFHLVPTQFVSRSGRLEQMQPLLDTTVSVLPNQRNGAGLVSEICRSLSVATGQIVVVGSGPWAQLAAHVTTITASDEAARSVLSRLIEEMPVLLSWQLFYDPGLHLYVLNIHPVALAPK